MAHPYLALRPTRNGRVSHYAVAGSKNPLPLGMGSVKAGNRFDLHVVALFKVRDEKLPVPFVLDELDVGEFIHFEFLVFRSMGIIKGPLF